MSGRTTKKHVRIYINGKDMSGYTCSIPSLSTVFDEKICAALSDEIKNGLLGHAAISPNTVNAFLDNTSDGLHETLNDARAKRTVIVAVGDKTDPSAGVPAFAGQFEQLDYSVSGEDFVNATVKFGEWVGDAVTKDYNKSWGLLLHENIAETAANSNAGVDGYRQDETSKGGFLVYQVLSGDGTATISIEDSEDDSSFSIIRRNDRRNRLQFCSIWACCIRYRCNSKKIFTVAVVIKHSHYSYIYFGVYSPVTKNNEEKQEWQHKQVARFQSM